jgi:hypothetical protein
MKSSEQGRKRRSTGGKRLRISRWPRSLAAALVLIGALVSMLGAPNAARAGAPAPFATVSGTCRAGGSDSFVTPAVTGAHEDPIARITTQGGPGVLKVDDDFISGDWVLFGGADTLWNWYSWTLPSGEAIRGQVTCALAQTDVPYTLDFFDPAMTPTSFAGASTRPPNQTPGDSNFAFRTPAAAHYVADLTLSQGAVVLTQNACFPTNIPRPSRLLDGSTSAPSQAATTISFPCVRLMGHRPAGRSQSIARCALGPRV